MTQQYDQLNKDTSKDEVKSKFNIIDQSINRVDALEKVTGKAAYISDLKFQNMLYGKVLRSKYPHARILNIDTSKAENIQGVKAIVTGEDTHFRGGEAIRDQPFLAIDKVRYVGEPIAAVAATDLATAEEAVNLIEVEYEELPAILEISDAIKPDSQLIHDKAEGYVHIPVATPIYAPMYALPRGILKMDLLNQNMSLKTVILRIWFNMDLLKLIQQ